MRNPAFQKIPGWAAAGYRRIFSGTSAMKLPMPGKGEAQCYLFPPADNDPLRFLFTAIWGDESLLIGIRSRGLLATSPALADLDLLQLPHDAAATVLEMVLEDFMDGLQQVSAHACTITTVHDPDQFILPESVQGVDFSFQGGRVDIQGSFFTDAVTLARLAELPPGQIVDNTLPALAMKPIPLPVNVLSGQAVLNMEEFTGLESGDIIFCTGMDSNEVLVQIAQFRFPAHRQDNHTIQITGTTIMSNEEDVTPDEEAVDQEPLIQDTSEIPVQLEFSIGRTSIFLGELEKIGHGYVFELTSGFDHPVTLLANGSPVGRGEIVDVDGRIGVRIVESKEDAGI